MATSPSLLEFETFLEIGETYFKKEEGDRTRDDLVFGRAVLNSEYISWLCRYPVGSFFDYCEVRMVDSGRCFVVTKSYEEMKALLKVRPWTSAEECAA